MFGKIYTGSRVDRRRPHDCTSFAPLTIPAGAVRKLHIYPVRGVASGQSVCLRRHHDDRHQGVDAAQFPAGAAADAAGGAAGALAQQCAHPVQVSPVCTVRLQLGYSVRGCHVQTHMTCRAP